MEVAALRDELRSYIDALPDHSLPALKPLLSFLVETPPIIETDLSDEENAMIEESLAEYKADPSKITSWAKIRRT
ncbi:MAG: hypothetical protein FWD88_02620 [Treponema sp.]|nr:hypothetical protein [Treponema sp.]